MKKITMLFVLLFSFLFSFAQSNIIAQGAYVENHQLILDINVDQSFYYDQRATFHVHGYWETVVGYGPGPFHLPITQVIEGYRDYYCWVIAESNTGHIAWEIGPNDEPDPWNFDVID